MKEIIEKTEFIKTIDSIKQDVINTRNKIMYNANRELINMYFRMGKNISENVKYGNNFISILSKSLKLEFTNSTGFSERNLRRMKAFYEQYKVFSNLPPAVADLPWTHNYILLEKVKDIEKELEEHMITKIRDVLLELGKGFCFIGNQYKISTNS